jgi:hypothetical protein
VRPNALIARAYVARGGRRWIVTRAMVSGVFLMSRNNPLEVSAAVVGGIILLSVGLSFLATHNRRESVLLANLGIGPLVQGVMFAVPALIGEIALGVAGAAFR